MTVKELIENLESLGEEHMNDICLIPENDITVVPIKYIDCKPNHTIQFLPKS